MKLSFDFVNPASFYVFGNGRCKHLLNLSNEKNAQSVDQRAQFTFGNFHSYLEEITRIMSLNPIKETT